MQTNLEVLRNTPLAEQLLLSPCLGGSRAPHGAGCLPWNAFLPREQKPKLPPSQPARPCGMGLPGCRALGRAQAHSSLALTLPGAAHSGAECPSCIPQGCRAEHSQPARPRVGTLPLTVLQVTRTKCARFPEINTQSHISCLLASLASGPVTQGWAAWILTAELPHPQPSEPCRFMDVPRLGSLLPSLASLCQAGLEVAVVCAVSAAISTHPLTPFSSKVSCLLV